MPGKPAIYPGVQSILQEMLSYPVTALFKCMTHHLLLHAPDESHLQLPGQWQLTWVEFFMAAVIMSCRCIQELACCRYPRPGAGCTSESSQAENCFSSGSARG